MDGKNYRQFDNFSDDAEFRGYVKAKLEEFDVLKQCVQKLSEQTWKLWGMVMGVSSVSAILTTFIVDLLSKKG